jgi:serine/threonine-protein kinase
LNRLAPHALSKLVSIPAKGLDASAPLKPDLVQKHLDKVLVSAEMRRSKKLCQFLRFTVDEVLQGHGSELKEYAIAIGVFRRGREFDPGADPIVRVQARRLRAKLERYYQNEGSDEPVRIEYPVGSYSPVFTRARAAISEKVDLAIQKIAILPFLSLGMADYAYFTDGLTEDLVHALSSSTVRVVGRVSCSEFKGLALDIRTIGERLGVSALVSGSVRMEGTRLRVMAQLVDSATGINVWSGVFDRELDGILATQTRISQEIAAAVQGQLAHGANETVSMAAGSAGT